ncbi:MAG TPA: DUF488 domain-containing protein [Candidatus Kapabacteria bacterium]|nr:DUF488 domain-containing protein [Candidatus Kapabacteria bacterium]
MEAQNKKIYTIGHSTHPIDEFIDILKHYSIEVLIDIRSLPGSRKFPQFNKENLEISMPNSGIEYVHLLGLGGRRRVRKDSTNNRWHNDSFKGYADYMETKEFEISINMLEDIAKNKMSCYMCAEVLWWRCHRSMVSDYLKNNNWEVLHILSKNSTQQHKYTEPAQIINGKLTYSDT